MSRFDAKRVWFVLIAMLVLGWSGCADPAADKPAAEVGEAAQLPAAETSGETLVVAAGSSIGFVGSKVTGSHDGGFESFNGEINLVDGDPTASSVSMVIDTTSLWADHPKLTEHLKSADFFDVERYPEATFVSTEIVEGETGYTVTGNLDLHGIEKSITFPADIVVGEGEVRVNAEFSVKRFDFNIVYPGRPDDLIRDDVVIKLDLTAVPQGSGF